MGATDQEDLIWRGADDQSQRQDNENQIKAARTDRHKIALLSQSRIVSGGACFSERNDGYNAEVCFLTWQGVQRSGQALQSTVAGD